MKLIIAGSRHLDIPQDMIDWIVAQFQDLDEVTEIISGKANGIDNAGEKFSRRYNIDLITFPADWNEYGKKSRTY